MSLCDKLFRADLWIHRRFEEAYYHVDGMTVPAILAACAKVEKISAAKYHYNTGSIGITRGERTLRHVRSKEKLFNVWHDLLEISGDVNGIGAFYLCREIPCRAWLFAKKMGFSKTVLDAHNQKMHQLFLIHYPVAQKTDEFRSTPKLKRILWFIYAHSFALANFLLSVVPTRRLPAEDRMGES